MTTTITRSLALGLVFVFWAVTVTADAGRRDPEATDQARCARKSRKARRKKRRRPRRRARKRSRRRGRRKHTRKSRRKRGRKLKIAVTGDDIGAVQVEVFEKFHKKATIYDRTSAISAMRRREARLGKKYGDADFRKMAKKIMRDLRRKHRYDARVHVRRKGSKIVVKVRARRCRKTVRWKMSALRSIDEFEARLAKISKALARCLKRRRR